ncbi:ribonuclease H-like domain-containing protein [Paenibacillus sp. YYML68]|uniref:ribonuclease H-like domain-containing protein n=1 Tax=Paenibacillus sp. YYML68 TaxID=2909250 RepID=UPI00248FBB74|nr:ribonuclease H-like domain-containing protein [Paenibacillus sp. YYML68]
MSSLRDRLQRHLKPNGRTEERENSSTATEGEADIVQQVNLADASDPEALGWAALGAVLQPGEHGDFVMRRLRFPLDHRHGVAELGELAGRGDALQRLLSAPKRTTARRTSIAPPSSRAAAANTTAATQGVSVELRPPSEDVQTPTYTNVSKLLFIDTETTGLGQGAGNVPFMVGIGFYEEDHFMIEQMLIRHPGEEASMLEYLQTKLVERPVLISYNGKSFDWPIVRNRFIMNRVPLPAEPQGHIDFLYPSRSLWRHTLASCRLGQVESDRLGVLREDDVPGSMAPVLYFQYLAERDPNVLAGVFRHNEWDVLTLAGLAIHFAKLLEGETDWRHIQSFGREEWYRYGLWLDKIGLEDAAVWTMEALSEDYMVNSYMDEARVATVDQAGGVGHMLPLARFFKKRKRYDVAVPLWKLAMERAAHSRTASLEPYVELSIYYERQMKQPHTALEYAERALDVLWRRQSLQRLGTARTAAPTKEQQELEKRLARLRQRVFQGEKQ